MILGISSFTYGWALMDGSKTAFTEKDLVAKALEFGVKCLQLGDNLPLHKMSDGRLSELKKSIDANHIRLEVGARKLSEAHLDRYIQMASSLRAPLLRFVVDDVGYEPEVSTIASILKNALPDLKKHKITLGIENHDRFKARELSNLMDAVSDHHVGICLDTVNSIGAGEGLEWVTSALAPYTVNLHIKDFSIRRFPHNMGFAVAGAPAGKGMLNVSTLMETLSQYARCQSAILEQWVIPEDSLLETIEKEKRWAEESIRFLRQLPYFITDTLPNAYGTI